MTIKKEREHSNDIDQHINHAQILYEENTKLKIENQLIKDSNEKIKLENKQLIVKLYEIDKLCKMILECL